VLCFGAAVDRWLLMCGSKMVHAPSAARCSPDYTLPPQRAAVSLFTDMDTTFRITHCWCLATHRFSCVT